MILAPLTGGGEGGITRQMPVAVRGKAQVCSLLVAGIAGSNHTEGIYIRLLSLLCVVWVASSVTSWSPVQRSPNGYVCVCVCLCVIKKLQNEAVCALFEQEQSSNRILGLKWSGHSQRLLFTD